MSPKINRALESYAKGAFFGMIILLVCLIAYGGWLLERKINWNLGYESQVDKRIDEKLKPILDRLDKLEHEKK